MLHGGQMRGYRNRWLLTRVHFALINLVYSGLLIHISGLSLLVSLLAKGCASQSMVGRKRTQNHSNSWPSNLELLYLELQYLSMYCKQIK